MSWIIRSRRALVFENLRNSFPEKKEQEIRALAKSFWRHLGMTAAEFIKIPSIKKSDLGALLEVEGLSNVEQALARGKGLLFLCAHIGNWEALGATYTLAAGSAAVLARPISNPYVDGWVNAIRRHHGETVITHHQVLREGLRWLKSNKPLAILMDHNLYKGGIFVDFFGRPAATSTILALLSLRLDCPIVPAHNVRVGGKLRAIFEPPLWPESTGDREEDIAKLTQRLSLIIEGWIRQHPEQWFWVHNRWKRKPEDAG